MVPTTSDALSQAAELLRSGNRQKARKLLAVFLRDNPDSAKGWWLMSYTVSDPDQQASCLKRVLRLYPDHAKARARLAALTGETDLLDADIHPKQKNLARQKTTIPFPLVALLIVFGCLGVLVVGYFGYQIFLSASVAQPTLMVAAQSPVESTTRPTSILPPTWTSTAAPPPTITATPTMPLAETDTPLVTNTSTPDPNATPTPIPEYLIGTGNGQYAPDFTLEDAITNEVISLQDYADQPVMLVFITTWCGYCEKEMPGLQAVYEKYYDQGLIVLVVGIGASKSALRTYANRLGLTFPILSDWEHDVARKFGASSIPTNYVIRKNGKIWQVNVGMMTDDELDIAANSVLKVP